MADKQNEESSSKAKENNVSVDKGDKNIEVIDPGSPSEAMSTVSKRMQTLKNNKKAAKSRLTRAKNQLNEMFGNGQSDCPLPSKNALRRISTQIASEMRIISKIICNLREIYATSGEQEDNTAVIDLLDKELEEIGAQVDSLIEDISKHIEERLAQGEIESNAQSYKSHVSREKSTKDKASSKESPKEKEDICPEQKKLMAKDAEERLQRMEQEQKGKENELKRLEGELELTKQRTEEARKVVALNKSRAEQAENLQIDGESDNDTIASFLHKDELERGLGRKEPACYQIQDQIKSKSNVLAPIKLKGVDLPNFSGDDRGDYPTWKAAFVLFG